VCRGVDPASLSSLQQIFPTMCHLQPKVSIAFDRRPAGEVSTLLDLVLKKLARSKHFELHNETPRNGASANNGWVPLFVPDKAHCGFRRFAFYFRGHYFVLEASQ
jgi:hypothetical protein